MMDDQAFGHPCQERPAGAAQQLLAALQAYGREVDRLRTGWDTESYRVAADQFSAMRDMAHALPPVRTAWIELLISRFEFAQVLWDRRGEPHVAALLHEAHERHAAAIDKLRAACVEVSGSKAPR